MGTWVEADRVESRGALPGTGRPENYKGHWVHLHWFKAPGGDWPAFDQVDPEQLDPYGVFVIWRGGNAAKMSTVLYVGRGAMKQELSRCQRDPVFREARDLYVTWAKIDDFETIDSVAAYLYQKLRPLWGEVVLVPPVAANPPWAA